jgi:aerobic carbon-monoxide dehydrogenase small subunit
MNISFLLNGAMVSLDTDPMRRLIDVLREDFGLVGVKESCGEGECGTCSILLDGGIALSCIIAIGAVHGREVTTIEGFEKTDEFHNLATAFVEAGAVQCGYCTPGMILAAHSLLTTVPDPDESQIREALSGNLCRCTGYNLIVQAVMSAAQRWKGSTPT